MWKHASKWTSLAASQGVHSDRRMPERSLSWCHDTARIGPASARCAKRSDVSRFIRRNTDGVIVENQGKTRRAGDLRVTLFPSKYSRVRIPSPALTARNKADRLPTGRPTSRAHPLFAGSEDTLWPFRLPPSGAPNRFVPRRVPVPHQDKE